jgi:hypothetical protein
MAPNLGGNYFRCIHVFSYLRYLNVCFASSALDPSFRVWTWSLPMNKRNDLDTSSISNFLFRIYIYTITPQFQTQGFLHLFQRSSHPFEIPTHLVPTKRSPAKDSEITKPQSPLKLLGFSETDDQGWP